MDICALLKATPRAFMRHLIRGGFAVVPPCLSYTSPVPENKEALLLVLQSKCAGSPQETDKPLAVTQTKIFPPALEHHKNLLWLKKRVCVSMYLCFAFRQHFIDSANSVCDMTHCCPKVTSC